VTDEQIGYAAADLILKVSEAAVDAPRRLHMLASGIAVIAIADDKGTVEFEGDPTAAMRMVLARHATSRLMSAHIEKLVDAGERGISADDMVVYLLSQLPKIRLAAVAGVVA
jgi:hypothetical protein